MRVLLRLPIIRFLHERDLLFPIVVVLAVIGVLSEGFEFILQPQPVDVWVPLDRYPYAYSRGDRFAVAVARMAPGTTMDQVDAEVARGQLMSRFGLTEVQATAILDMQLRRLAALERQKNELMETVRRKERQLHSREMELLDKKLAGQELAATVLLKGATDVIRSDGQEIEIEGGSTGMTKGGTGDVLAGLVAGLYCNHDALTACVVGSYVNKKAGEALHEKVGPYFNASDLAEVVPEVLWQEINKN